MTSLNLFSSQVTSLNLDGQFIGKFTGLERLVNLRWASLDRNCITKFEGIEHCSALVELSIQDNCVYKLDGSFLALSSSFFFYDRNLKLTLKFLLVEILQIIQNILMFLMKKPLFCRIKYRV